MDYEKYDSMTTTQLVEEMADLKEALDQAAKVKSALQKEYDFVREGKLPEVMVSEGITNITVAGAGKVHLQGDLRASIKAADREKAYEWLADHGYGDLIIETVNSGTLKAAAKGWLEKAMEIPSFININPYTRAILSLKRN